MSRDPFSDIEGMNMLGVFALFAVAIAALLVCLVIFLAAGS